MHISSTEFFGGHCFSSGCFHKRRAAQENRSLILHDDGFVTHGGNISSSRGTRTQHGGNLVDALRRHDGLVVEDSSEVIAVWEDFRL